MKHSLLATMVLTAALGAPLGVAEAQMAEGSQSSPMPRNYVAAGAAMLPDYAGSDDYRVIPFGAARFELGGVSFRTQGPGLAASLYESGPWELGAYVRWSGGRDDVEDEVVDRMRDVDSSLITGGYARLTLAENVLSERDRFGLGVDLGVDALGNFDGLAWSASADYGVRVSRGVFAALSASVSGFSDDYADTLFSVDAADAAATGLALYTAEGGVRDVGVTAIVDVAVSQSWSVTGVAGYSRLLGDYADSPIVSVRGSEDQVFLGLALGRRF
ncbi:MipA/OmpV family protein [Oceanicaulis sp. LC35]|uniref:MipA/OmpV family protein n=1 Tax=Oceanicaulis sp. LC35 TaxID=3349635 RepID=UPI003F8294D1